MYPLIEPRHLRAFLALAEELHFGRAAEKLGMAQPPFSQQIRRLEDRVGIRLFERTTRAVRLTDAGQIFLEKARGAAHRMDEAFRLARLASSGARAHLSIGFIQPAMYSPLPDALRRFVQANPHVMLDVSHLSSAQQIEALRQDRLDLGLIRPPAELTGLQVEIVAREGFAVAFPAGHRAGRLGSVPLAKLAAERFIDFRSSAGDIFPQHVAPYCRRAGFDPNFTHKTDTVAATLTLVAAGLGVALVPGWVTHVAPAEVLIRPTHDIPPLVELAVAWNPQMETDALRGFLAVLRAAKSKLAPPGRRVGDLPGPR